MPTPVICGSCAGSGHGRHNTSIPNHRPCPPVPPRIVLHHTCVLLTSDRPFSAETPSGHYCNKRMLPYRPRLPQDQLCKSRLVIVKKPFRFHVERHRRRTSNRDTNSLVACINSNCIREATGGRAHKRQAGSRIRRASAPA